jgi:outer membrane protein assembly factor BamE
MSRRQVQFVAGSPMLSDVFHQDRWDYVYQMKPGRGERTSEHVSLFFEDDALVRISGTLHPGEDATSGENQQEQVTLVVPPKERVPPGILNRLWHWVTFRKPDEFQP